MAVTPLSHWHTQNATPATPVIQPTPGDAEAVPYHQLPGSSGVTNADIEAARAAQSASTQRLFPVFDGATNLLPDLPADFANPKPSTFLQWHAAHQAQYLHDNSTAVSVYDDPPGTNPPANAQQAKFATISASGEPDLHYLLATNGQAILINTLQATDVAKLPLADQTALANSAAFRTLVGDAYNLVPNSLETYPGPIRDALVADINDKRTTILASMGLTTAADITAMITRLDNPTNAAQRSTEWQYYFVKHLDFLIEDLQGMAIFDRDEINSKVEDVLKRFQLIQTYSGRTDASVSSNGPSYGLNSSDSNASIDSAVEIFTRIEGRLFDLASSGRHIAQTGKLVTGRDATGAISSERILDVPGMVFTFQTYEDYEATAVSEAKTEEIRQRNKLLQDYSAMQQLVNDTLSKFDLQAFNDANPNNSELDNPLEETVALLKFSSITDLDTAQRAILSMFASAYASTTDGTTPNPGHPIEQLEGITRPLENLTNGTALRQHNKTVWDLFATNLSEATKLLSQDTQILMNDINAVNKEKNRHFQLATNSIKKMNDMIGTIMSASA